MTILLENYKRDITNQQLKPLQSAIIILLGLDIKPFNHTIFMNLEFFGRYLEVPKSISGYSGVEFNRNNSFTFDFTLSFKNSTKKEGLTTESQPKYRVNDKFSIYLIIDYTNKKNDLGWVGFESSDIIIEKRNREILQNDLTGKYSINDKMTLNLTARYYWFTLIIKHSSLYKMMVLYLKTTPTS
jgi:hypothetical protein